MASHHRVEKTVVVSTTSVPTPPARKKLVYGWVQDASGSMSGAPMDASLAGLDYMSTHVFRPTDFLGLTTYNCAISVLHKPIQLAKVDLERDKDAIRQRLRSLEAGGTRTYDGVGASIEALQAMHRDEKFRAVMQDAVFELLLVTDGDDNRSTEYTLERLADLVAHPGLPNFHFVVVAVKMSDADKRKLRVLCTSEHASFLDVGSLSELQHTLRGVAERVQQRLVTTTITTTTHTSSSAAVSARGSVPKLTAEFSRARLTSIGEGSAGGPRPRKPAALLPPSSAPRASKKKEAPKVCTHYQAGSCRFGSACRNLHVA
jgi:hypothetical protein